VRLVRFEGLREVVPDWRKSFDMERVQALSPRLAWLEEIADTEIHTYLKEALAQTETDGQLFVIPEVPSYRDFDHVIEVAIAVPILRDLRTSFHHKTAVKGIVREFLERKDVQPAHGPAPSTLIASPKGHMHVLLSAIWHGPRSSPL